MTVKNLIFTILCAINWASAQELVISKAKSKETSLKLGISLGGQLVESHINKARSVGPRILVDIDHHLSESLAINLETGFVVEAGSTQNAFDNNAYSPRKDFILKEASLNYAPIDWLKLSLGAINQKILENSLFVANTAFLASKEILEFKSFNKKWGTRWGFEMIQAIPNNRDLSTRLGNVDEGTPKFFHEKIFFEYFDSSKFLKLHLGHFAFDKLSTSVAYESLFLGNSVSGIGKENAHFNQNFIGWNTGLKFSTLTTKNIGLNLKANFHQNTQIKQNNKGMFLSIGPKLKLASGTYTFEVLGLKNEANSTVAFYSSGNLGHTNRKGYGAHFIYQDSDDSLFLDLSYTDVDTIIKTPYQKKSQIVFLELRKNYEFF